MKPLSWRNLKGLKKMKIKELAWTFEVFYYSAVVEKLNLFYEIHDKDETCEYMPCACTSFGYDGTESEQLIDEAITDLGKAKAICQDHYESAIMAQFETCK